MALLNKYILENEEEEEEFCIRCLSGGIAELLIIIYNIHANCLDMI